MSKKKANPDPATVTRTEEEVNEVIDKTAAQDNEGGSRWPGMTYEQGVRNALDWILGNNDDNPMED